MLNSIKSKISQWKRFKADKRTNNPKLILTLDVFETLLNLIIALFLRQFIVQSSLVFSGSMIPTLRSASHNTFADRLIVNKLVYHFNQPERGEIVLFNSPITMANNTLNV